MVNVFIKKLYYLLYKNESKEINRQKYNMNKDRNIQHKFFYSTG